MSSYENYSETSKRYDATRVPMGIEVILGTFVCGPASLGKAVVLDTGSGTDSYSVVLNDYVGRV